MNDFDSGNRLPKILPKCGHTICLLDIKYLMKTTKACSLCNIPFDATTPDDLVTNDKLLKIIQSSSKMPKLNKGIFSGVGVPPGPAYSHTNNRFSSTVPGDHNSSANIFIGTENQITSKKVYCGKHRDKEIEYYCKLCHSIVCPKCMFAEHNGHELAQLEDVTSIIKQNIHDLNKLLMNTKRITEDKRNYIIYLKKEIDRLREVQLK